MSTLQKGSIGAASGVLIGAVLVGAWWWGWGCRVCAPGSTPWTFLGVGVGAGGVLGAWLGADQPG